MSNPNKPEDIKAYWLRKLIEIEGLIVIAKSQPDVIMNISQLDTLLPTTQGGIPVPVLRLTIDLNESRLNDIRNRE